MNKSTVLFFDSGMGGLSVYREAKKLMPDNQYLYCFDNAGFPYSEKSEETIIQRTLDICKKINQDYPLDAIVIACNTASTVVLPPLREQFSIPIVGTVQPSSLQQKSHKRNILGCWRQRAQLNALMLMILSISLPPIV